MDAYAPVLPRTFNSESMKDISSNDTRSQQTDNTAFTIDVERQEKNVTFVLCEEKLNRPYKRLLSWLEKPGFNSAKTSKPREVDSLTTALRIEAIEQMFGLPIDRVCEWQGVWVFCSHLENCFKELQHDQFEIIWKVLGRAPPSNQADGWHWCLAVIRSVQDISKLKDVSIEKVYKQLLENSKVSIGEKSAERQQVLRAIFAVLCWTTATLKPIFDEEAFAAAIKSGQITARNFSVAAESSSTINFSTELEQPLRILFYKFRSSAGKCYDSDGTQSNDVLHQSSLDYSSLFKIGRVKLKLVDTLTAHLEFNRSTRTLSIFRFPSYCAINVLFDGKVEIFKNITTNVLPQNPHTESLAEDSALHREVLLSYRLLFGQSSRSRKLLRKLLNQPSKIVSRPHKHGGLSPCSSNIMSTDIDPFLFTICTAPLLSSLRYFSSTSQQDHYNLLPGTLFPSSTLDIHDQLQECDTYSACDDFPVFGHRLLKLQRYSMRQQPSRVRDFWRDRRNMFQWYTFWAVLFIGGMSIAFGVLQIVLSGVQIAVTINP